MSGLESRKLKKNPKNFLKWSFVSKILYKIQPEIDQEQ